MDIGPATPYSASFMFLKREGTGGRKRTREGGRMRGLGTRERERERQLGNGKKTRRKRKTDKDRCTERLLRRERGKRNMEG